MTTREDTTMAKKKEQKNSAGTKSIKQIMDEYGVNKQERKALAVSDLRVDAAYQREYRSQTGKKIADNFHPAVCGDLLVSKRKNGAFYVVDGNHRLNAVKKLGAKHWYCIVLSGLSRREEAEVWELCNSVRNRILGVEKFKAQLFRKDPVAVEIDDLVARMGFFLYLDSNGSPNHGRGIKAVGTLVRMYKNGGIDSIENVLDIILCCWDKTEVQATNGTILWGLHAFCREPLWVGQWDKEKLCQKLRKISVKKLLRDVEMTKELWGGSTPKILALTVAKAYNKGLRKGKPLDMSLGVR